MPSALDPDFFGSLAPFVSACLSLVATAFLLCRLRSLDFARRRRLLVRQLQHMALANLLYLVTEVVHQVIRMDWIVATRGTPSRQPLIQQTNFTCRLNEVSQDFGARAAMLFEVHVAVAFAASIFGAYKTMRFLYALLPYIWIIAIVIASVEAYFAGIFWLPSFGCVGKGGDYIYVAFSSLCFLACAACYVASSFGVGRAGRSVQLSVWKRIRLYLLVGLVTLLPFIVYFVGGPLTAGDPVGPFKRQEFIYILAETSYDVGGLLTFLVYAWQTKYVRSEMRSARPGHVISSGNNDGVPRELSFRVNFRMADSVVEEFVASEHTRSGESLVLEYYDNSYQEAS